MSDCIICYEKFNKSNHKDISCSTCDKKTCRTCVQTYLKTITSVPHCIHCKTEWTFEYLSDITPKSFHNLEYRKHRTEIALDREKGLLIETQPIAERLLNERRLAQELNVLGNERHTLLQLPPPNYDEDDLIIELKDLIIKTERRLESLRKKCESRRQEIFRTSNSRLNEINSRIEQIQVLLRGEGGASESKEERKQFIKGCPVDDCRGFLSTSWKCGLCETWVCKDCHVPKKSKDDDEHMCDKDTVASAKLIADETKPCPSCQRPIYKILGCDQMFCTICNTPFSWKSGKKVTGVIHNPHFYEWQRKQNNGVAPRVIGDIICGGLPTIEQIDRHFLAEKISTRTISQKDINNRHRLINHILHVEIPYYPEDIGNINQDLRVKYLLKEITNEQWSSLIQKNEKKMEKNHAVVQVLRMFTSVMTDMFNNILSKKNKDISEIWSSMEKLKSYTNDNLSKINNRFNNITPYISDTWECISIKQKDIPVVISDVIWNNIMDIPTAGNQTRLDSEEDGSFVIGPTSLGDGTGFCLTSMLAVDYASDIQMKIKHMHIKMTNARKISPGNYEIHIYSKIDDIFGKDIKYSLFALQIGSRVTCSVKSAKTSCYLGSVIDIIDDLYTIVYDDSSIRSSLTRDLLRPSLTPIPNHFAVVTEQIIPFKFDISIKDTIKHVFETPIVLEPGQIIGIVNRSGPMDFSWSNSWNGNDALIFNYLYSFDIPKRKGDIQWRVQTTNATRPGFNLGIDFF